MNPIKTEHTVIITILKTTQPVTKPPTTIPDNPQTFVSGAKQKQIIT